MSKWSSSQEYTIDSTITNEFHYISGKKKKKNNNNNNLFISTDAEKKHLTKFNIPS